MIHLLQPPPRAGFISGGYRFNEELGRRLRAQGLGRLWDVPVSELRESPPFDPSEQGGTLVADSIYLDLWPVPAWVAERAGRVRLLLHYLPSAAPGLEGPERERRLARERAWLGSVGGVLVTSSRMAEDLRGVHGRQARIAVPGVSACFHLPAVARGEEDPDSLTVVSVGTLLPPKGQLELARLLASAAAPGRRLRGVLIGDDRIDPEYANEVREAARGVPGLELTLTGCLPPEEVADQLRAADLFVSASVFESYGMALPEALACSCPVLAYDVGEARRWVREGENGSLVAADDRAALASRFERMVSDPTLLARLGAGARDLELPTWEATLEQFLAGCAHEEEADA